jgi:hypothetical protein
MHQRRPIEFFPPLMREAEHRAVIVDVPTRQFYSRE